MAGNIKGITIEINGDTTRLDRALRNVNNTGRDLNNQLKDIDKALKFNPGNTELIAQRQRVLAESVENTREKLSTLREAHRQAQQQLANGEIGQDEFDALTREIIRAENQLNRFEGELRQANSTTYQFGESLGNFSKKTEELGHKLAPVSAVASGALAGLTGLAVQAGKTADDINTLSKVTGVSVESLQKFKLAEDVIDVSTETMAKSLAKLTKSMDGAKKGSKNQQEAFEILGVSITNTSGHLRDNEDVFNDVINALSKIPNETERDAIAFQLFGKSAQELNPLILGGADALKEIGDRAQEAGLIMGQEALDNINAFNDELDTTKAVVTQAGLQLGASVGQVLLPLLQTLAEKIQGLAQHLSQMDPATVKIILGVLAVVASIAPLLIAIGKMGAGVSVLIKLFSAGGAGATALSSAMAFLTGPIGIVIALITALGVAFVVAYKNNEEFRNKVQEAWKQVQEFIGKAIESIKKLIEGFVKLAKDLWDKHGKEITAIAKAMWDLISTIIKTAMENIKTIVNAFVGAFNWIWQNFGGTITTIAKNTWDGINKVISGVLEILKGIITAWTALIKGDWNTFGESLKTIAKGIWDIISGIFTTAINNLKTIVKNGLDAIVNFFKNLKLPEIKIPKIKLPHFRVSGSFSINPPKTPSFGVDWYKDGGIFTRPTIFNTPYGFKGVGEAGAEAVLPISKLDDIVANAIKKTGTGNAVYNINFNGDMQIRSDEDIRRLARELGEYVLSQNRALGGAY